MNLLTQKTLTQRPLLNSNGLLSTARATSISRITVTNKRRRSALSLSRTQFCAGLALPVIFVSCAATKAQTPIPSPPQSNTTVAAASRETAAQPRPVSEEKTAQIVVAGASASDATAVNQPRSGSSSPSLFKRFVRFPLWIVKAIAGAFGEGSKSGTNPPREGGVGEVVGSKILDVTVVANLPGDTPGVPVLSDSAATSESELKSTLFPVWDNSKQLGENDRTGYMDREGNLVISFRFYYSSEFSEGRAAVFLKRDDKVTYINESGEVVIAPQYDDGFSFHEGLAQVRTNGLVGFIDRQGNEIVKPQFAMAENFRGGLAAVRFKLAGADFRQWGYIDTTGRVAIPPRFEVANSFSEGLAAVVINGQIGYIDAKGNWAIAPRFQRMASLTYDLSLPNFSDGLAVMREGNRYGYIDNRGTVVIAPYFETSQSFAEGLAAVRIADKVGYINKSGAIAIQPQFDNAEGFSEGMAAVKAGEKWGFIDQTGAIVIKPQFEMVMAFKGGLARVWKGNEQDYIRKNGVFILPAKSLSVATPAAPQSSLTTPKDAAAVADDETANVGTTAREVAGPDDAKVRKTVRPTSLPFPSRDKSTVYIEFERAGKREPLYASDSKTGIWLRLHNNSKRPIVLDMRGVPSDDYGDASLTYDVLSEGRVIIPDSCHVCSFNSLGPGHSLLFSVPADHLSLGRSLRIKFSYEGASANSTEPGPYVYFHALPIIPNEDGFPTSEQLTKQIPQTFCGAKASTDLVSSEELKKRAEHRVLPEYPKSCRCTGIVSVYVRIDVNGKVDCVAIKGGNPLAAVYAGRAALQWTFKAMETNGKPVGAVGYLEFRFGNDGTVSY